MEYLALNPPSQSFSVTVVIAAFNEGGNLESLLYAIERTFQNMGLVFPVLLIDDGSTDNSAQILSSLEKKYSFLKIIRHLSRRGLTEVLKTAVTNADSDWLYLTAGDLESDPQSDLPLLLEACEPGIDAVAGWRQNRKDGKWFASFIANFACRLVFCSKVHDMNWIKLVRCDHLASLPLEKVTHRYLLPVLAAKGCSIAEVATPWHPRKVGKSKFGSKRLVVSAISFFQLWWWFYVERRVTKLT